MRNLSYENDEPVGGTHFHVNCSFDAEAQGNSEMVYSTKCNAPGFLNCTIGTNTGMDTILEFFFLVPVNIYGFLLP